MVQALKATGANPEEIAKTMMQVRLDFLRRGHLFHSVSYSKAMSKNNASQDEIARVLAKAEWPDLANFRHQI